MFTTKLDVLDNYDGASLVVMLGACDPGAEVPAENILRFSEVDGASLSVISRLNPFLMRHGVTLLVSSHFVREAFFWVRQIQKSLVFNYTKYVWFPKQDTSTPDPFDLGHDKGPLADLAYRCNVLENLPFLMAYPRAKAIQDMGLSCPVLALSPGPSLVGLRPHFAELAARFLVVCISRSLEFCHFCGVVPDVVVQLDTHPEQATFYKPEMDFSHSWLLMLSSAPVKKYASRFAGAFAIDTFLPQAFKEAYDMRCSWLSSLIPTLGAVELFCPKTVLLAGADLSYSGSKYFNGGLQNASHVKPVNFDHFTEIAAVRNGHFPVRMIDGQVGETTLQFMATANEAETVAQEISRKNRTAFFNVTGSGILDPSIFATAAPEDFLQEPLLDRRVLREAMEKARHNRQEIHSVSVRKYIRLHTQRSEALLPQARMIVSGPPDSPAATQLLSAGKLITFLHPLQSPKDGLQLCLKLVEKYHKAASRAETLQRLNDMASEGQEIPVLALTDEMEDISARLSARFPRGAWKRHYSLGRTENPNWFFLSSRKIPEFIGSHPVILASSQYMDAYDYLLSLLPCDHVCCIEDLLRLPWPGFSSL
ncbi:DUF115 domain-containing protein [Desulfovibrio sulfodismutans]|uniref:DUF115 domain-containing protein n=1 Tax=Desulfolutivibrio sulfodismutans TaxID=63561 RepID=A0A7K3NKF8_9BACT|nr:6-hydroxymethylpterin diphosphokinase MptE-like protein [Desulfolutivibrio sulfodismutans]NDY56684.1 DUF115 domain-containing protein [Desulfolutivibrio sulfodismutans]